METATTLNTAEECKAAVVGIVAYKIYFDLDSLSFNLSHINNLVFYYNSNFFSET